MTTHNQKLKHLIIGVVILFTLVGCTESTSIVTPEKPANNVVRILNDDENLSKPDVEESDETTFGVFQYLDTSKIDLMRAMEVLRVLTSKEYDGRKAGLDPSILAEDYIVEIFEEIGLDAPESLNGYKQYYNQRAIYPVRPTEIEIVGSDYEIEAQVDFAEKFYVGNTYYDAEFTSEMKYIVSADDLLNNTEELDGKVLLMTSDVFYNNLTWKLIGFMQKDGIMIEGIIVKSDPMGAGGMIVSHSLKGEDEILFDEEDPILMNMRSEVFDHLKTISEEGAKIKISMDFELVDVKPANIVGVIPGKNEDGENETLIIGAHIDHTGNNMNGTYNAGALDNASGVGAVVELARIISASEQPENTIVFVLFNGEEDGMKGSTFFVENPPIEFDKETTKMINLDMVGSINQLPLLICSPRLSGKDFSSEVADVAERLSMSYETVGMGSSDHVMFAVHDIPAIMLIHLDYDNIHTPMDTVDNAISEERFEEVIKLGLALIDKEAYQDN
ncbi:MAG: Zn-dependent exopeptidase M28 [Clostridiales bacterium]|nr:Zn-dependent exopeptidase M28 [Clostridiales bacterium]